jgi:uncharacterized membrane protein YkvA (DUF1232 family)
MYNTSMIEIPSLWDRIKTYAKKVGRVAARPVLLLYYVMKSDDTPKKDKLTIFGALAYVILPIDLIKAKRIPIIGWVDEVVSLAVAVQRMQKYITPEMERKADETLDRWFAEYTRYEEVTE